MSFKTTNRRPTRDESPIKPSAKPFLPKALGVVDPIPIIGRGYNVVATARSVTNVSARC